MEVGYGAIEGAQFVDDELDEDGGHDCFPVGMCVSQLLCAAEVVLTDDVDNPVQEAEDVGHPFVPKQQAVVVDLGPHELLLVAFVDVGEQLGHHLDHHPHHLDVVHQEGLPPFDLGQIPRLVCVEHGAEEVREDGLEEGGVVGEEVAELDDGVADEVLAVMDGGDLEVQMRLEAVLVDSLKNVPVMAGVGLARHVVQLRNQGVQGLDVSPDAPRVKHIQHS